MQFVGWTLALCLVYLLVAGKGVKALSGIVNAVVGGVTTFVKPVDPIASLESALGATSPSSSSSSPANPALAGVTGSSGAPNPALAGVTGSSSPGNSAGTGAPDALPPTVAAKVANWGVPASLLKAKLTLNRTASAAITAGKETVKQERAAEERLIPRSKYPAYWAH